VADERHVYGEINNAADLREVFESIRSNAGAAQMRPVLTEMYERAGEVAALAQAPAWDEKFGSDVGDLRRIAEEEYRRTILEINRRAREIGTEADYDQ
jgi:hypothetical protein